MNDEASAAAGGVLTVRDSAVQLLTRNDYVVAKNVEGISHEQALMRIGPGGSNLNWLLGHMTASRDVCTRMLGAEPAWDREVARLYGRGSEVMSDGDARRIEDLAAAHARAGRLLAGALTAADAETLSSPSPRNSSETVMEAIWFLVWHDTYHTGQTALYRRLAGLEGVF